MNIQEDIRINNHSIVVGYPGTLLGEVFSTYVKEYGVDNIYFICSLVYNLGKIHGKREERARRKIGGVADAKA